MAEFKNFENAMRNHCRIFPKKSIGNSQYSVIKGKALESHDYLHSEETRFVKKDILFRMI